MSRVIMAAAALISLGCAGFLLLSPMDGAAVFLANSIGKLLFPHLDPYRRHKKLTAIAGMILVIIITAGITAFIIKSLNRLPHR